MKKELRKFTFYVVLFFIFLFWNLIISPVNLDEVWNYGFAHNIYNGLIPYKDFNMVITPLYPFIISLPFYLFGSNMLVFHITNACMLTILSSFLFKLVDKKALIIILFLLFPLPITFPSYNIFLFFLLVLIIYCEKNCVNDYIIGILLAFVCLTKQSVGICMLLPSLYYLKDKHKLFKRFIGFIGPCFMFLVYLLCTNSIVQFFDLCLFGLFDFAEENGKQFNVYWFLFIIVIVFTFILIKKDKRDIANNYALAFYSILIPLFDTYHFQVMLLGFLFIIIQKLKFLEKINLTLLFVGIVIGVSSVYFIKRYDSRIVYPNDIKYFEYRLLDYDSINFTKEVNSFIKENSDKEIIFLCSNGYYFRIVNDMKIGYIDLINAGNWGYNGSDKIFDTISNIKNAIYIVDESELDEVKQTDKKIIKYILENGRKVKTIRIYDIYILES